MSFISSIFAGSFDRNGPATSLPPMVYWVSTGFWSTDSFCQSSSVRVPVNGNCCDSAKARSAFFAFSPNLPSISPGEKCARSSSTCRRMPSGVTASAGSFFDHCAELMPSGLRAGAAADCETPNASNTAPKNLTAVIAIRTGASPRCDLKLEQSQSSQHLHVALAGFGSAQDRLRKQVDL